MAAKWWPKTIHLLVGSKSWPLRRRSAGVARWSFERHHAGGDEFGVEAVADGVGAGGGQHQPDAVDVLAAEDGDGAQRDSRGDGDGGPADRSQDLHGVEYSVLWGFGIGGWGLGGEALRDGG